MERRHGAGAAHQTPLQGTLRQALDTRGCPERGVDGGRGEDAQARLQWELTQLAEQLALMRQRLFGASSEKRKPAQEEKARPRTQKSAPLVAAIREWALAQRSMPGSALRSALEYMLGLWRGLTVFLTNTSPPPPHLLSPAYTLEQQRRRRHGPHR
ncbi:transposase [Archangium sp.]|uniref:IS66 family transposase n=1 Tax=Archangium sp. TaxID=1872627 RepID=UPI003899A81B